MSHRGRRNNFNKGPKPVPNDKENEIPADNSPVAQMFRKYQSELDARYDKYERLVKKGRDLTIESKRIIFLLHRISSKEKDEEILQEAESRLSDLCTDVVSGISSELSKSEVYQFLRAFSPGLQEFVEAVSFYYFLKYGRVVSLEEVHNPDFLQQKETDVVLEVPLSALLTPSDYILGIADVTGELMRMCIQSVATGDLEQPFALCQVLRRIHDALLPCNHSRELRRKFFVLKTSLQKAENACYAIKIRGSEIPQHMLADVFATEDDYKDMTDCDL